MSLFIDRYLESSIPLNNRKGGYFMAMSEGGLNPKSRQESRERSLLPEFRLHEALAQARFRGDETAIRRLQRTISKEKRAFSQKLNRPTVSI